MSIDLETNRIRISSPDLALLAGEVLDHGASFRFKATGCSMSPFVRNGDILTLAPVSTKTLRFGDVIAYKMPSKDRMAVHRIIGVRSESFLIKGDNLASTDGFIYVSRIIGRVTRIERKGKGIRFGLGCERKVIALLSRFRLIPLLLIPARKVVRFLLPENLPA